ncbi:MAG: SRPBCC domain-containing protein [Flavobacteriales bacterium]|nr:SRPBCC domain-containing protein [Flavobacteriales bacterium]MCC6939378.1 SRPBCC domain-containing protein [Flavobacteriales bacterium]
MSTAPAPPPPKPKRVGGSRSTQERITMEFLVHSAPNVLYELISTPSGFSEWYCDDVNVRGDQYTFMWNGEEEATTMVGRKLGEVIRFHRNDDEDEETFFEFRVRIDAMTNEVALIVTDHAEPDEVEETRSLWASQIASLVRVLGA